MDHSCSCLGILRCNPTFTSFCHLSASRRWRHNRRTKKQVGSDTRSNTSHWGDWHYCDIHNNCQKNWTKGPGCRFCCFVEWFTIIVCPVVDIWCQLHCLVRWAPDIYSDRQEMRNSPCGAWDVLPVLAQDSGVKMPPKLIQVWDQFGGQLPSDLCKADSDCWILRRDVLLSSWVVWNHLGILEVRREKFRHGEQPEPGALPSHSPSFADANRGIQSEVYQQDLIFCFEFRIPMVLQLRWAGNLEIMFWKAPGKVFQLLTPGDDWSKWQTHLPGECVQGAATIRDKVQLTIDGRSFSRNLEEDREQINSPTAIFV